jgi:hypothetical protein
MWNGMAFGGLRELVDLRDILKRIKTPWHTVTVYL